MGRNTYCMGYEEHAQVMLTRCAVSTLPVQSRVRQSKTDPAIFAPTETPTAKAGQRGKMKRRHSRLRRTALA